MIQVLLFVLDWDVAYSSNPTAPGGYYRSMLGRAVLKTRDMVQSIDAPDGIRNKVAFAAFGVLDGQVTLQGELILTRGVFSLAHDVTILSFVTLTLKRQKVTVIYMYGVVFRHDTVQINRNDLQKT